MSNNDPNGQPKYYVDQEHIEEMSRLLQQSHFLMKQFGGICPEHPSFEGVEHVLDIACGPGQWITEVARAHPHMQLIGFDISQRMIEFAQSKAARDNLKNVQFEVGDATKFPLRYANESFDLVNVSLVYAFMSRTLWPRLITECYRLLKPGGYLRLIQEDANIQTNSPALHEYHFLGCQALYREGAGYYTDQLGVIPRLPAMFKRAGFQILSTKHNLVDVSYGCEGYQMCYTDYKILLEAMKPFLVRWRVATQEEVDDCYRRLVREMRYGVSNEEGGFDPFVGLWDFYSIFGQKPVN
ncbi:class I SAM-dependent methyltransferase [Dictyobacter formicarum]|uniref:Methyltransferase domain-containing protein n=1 Tax=Dictyobacter formicarum TaxID=2778368 RepID=A0ABQ3V907_9CHLR|nr:class I SAM-dependent methyltransferase [Dictyobacter formicarum]GHO82324.1 hypothetical protein KSZ_03300 [Dictyobacter formicarum]